MLLLLSASHPDRCCCCSQHALMPGAGACCCGRRWAAAAPLPPPPPQPPPPLRRGSRPPRPSRRRSRRRVPPEGREEVRFRHMRERGRMRQLRAPCVRPCVWRCRAGPKESAAAPRGGSRATASAPRLCASLGRRPSSWAAESARAPPPPPQLPPQSPLPPRPRPRPPHRRQSREGAPRLWAQRRRGRCGVGSNRPAQESRRGKGAGGMPFSEAAGWDAKRCHSDPFYFP